MEQKNIKHIDPDIDEKKTLSDVIKWVDILGQVTKDEEKREKYVDLCEKFGYPPPVPLERQKELLQETAEGKKFYVFFEKEDFADAKDEKGSNSCPYKPRDGYCSTININHPVINKVYRDYCDFLCQDLLTHEQRVEFERIVMDALAKIGIDERQFRHATFPDFDNIPETVTVLDSNKNVLGTRIYKNGRDSEPEFEPNMQNPQVRDYFVKKYPEKYAEKYAPKRPQTHSSRSSHRFYNRAYDIPDECYEEKDDFDDR